MGRLTLVLLLAVAALGAGVYVAFRHVPNILGETGCTAGTGRAAVALDPQQAQIAATIAGVAHQREMPSRALTVAYATAMQETHLHDPDYGDLDSVGVFQQRPSEGWGPASKLIDPVYASTRFFRALAQVPGYQRMPVYKAAQAVQHSADGYAYKQYQGLASHLTTAFTGAPRAVWCWPPGHATGQGTAHPGPPGDRQGVRAVGRKPVRHQRRRAIAAGPGPAVQPGLVGRGVAGDPRRKVQAARGALRRLPLAGPDGPYRVGERRRRACRFGLCQLIACGLAGSLGG